MTIKRRWLPFVLGVLTGTMLFIVLATLLVYFGGQQVWLVRVNTQGVADKMEGAAQVMIMDVLPDYIEQLEPSIPTMVADKVDNQFGDVKFYLGGNEFAMPQEFVDQLEENYQQHLAESILNLLSSLPMDEMGMSLSRSITDIVENSLYAEFNSQTLGLQIIDRYLTVPVKVEFINQSGVEAFRLQLYQEDNTVEGF